MSILATFLCLMIAVAAAAQTPAIRYEPAPLEVEGIGKVNAELGRFTVLEDRSKPQGRQIELVFGRLKSTAATPGAPIVYLDGGPGGSGIGIARVPGYYRLFDQLRAVGDVILLSQRGTGFSTPRLACRASTQAPPDVFVSADTMTAAMAPGLKACAEEWRGKGVDLSSYNTQASADDLEDLRRALGVPTISLLGFSYGTHLALAAVRRHSTGLARVVLAGTEGPDHSQKLPHTFDLQLARIAALEASLPAPPSPPLVETMASVLRQLETKPVQVDAKVQGRSEAVRLTIGKEGFQYLLRRDIGDTNDTSNVVRLIRDTARGNYEMLSRFAARRYAELSGGNSLMGIAMDCGSGLSPERSTRIARELPTGVLGRMTNYPFHEICEFLQLPALPESYRAPIVSTTPTLFISGTLDSNTPPYQAEEVRWGFPNSTHIVVDNAGHESTLPLPDVQRAIVDFLKGMDVSGRRIAAPSPLR